MVFARIVTLILFALFSGNLLAKSCLDRLPAGAEVLGDVALCRVKHNGKLGNFACQRYQDGDRVYAILFNGGTIPVAIYASRLGGIDTLQLVWSHDTNGENAACDLARPGNVPIHATFLGAAICEDDAGKNVPCSLYRHEVARNMLITHHMVFFDAMGKGPKDKLVFPMGRNQRALMAELAYQLGKAKLNTGCCRDQAAAYLRFAYESFPSSRVYQHAWFSVSEVARSELPANSVR